MPNYTKLFNSIVTSTIWTEDDKTRILWITMLAMSDQNGEIHASIPGLARIAGIDIESVEKALDAFLSPDTYSRTPDNEGRRIAKIDGGWELLNHAKYRLMASKEDSKAATAARVKRHRDRNAHVTVCNAPVTVRNGSVTVGRDIAEAEAEADTYKDKTTTTTKSDVVVVKTPLFEEVQKFAQSQGMMISDECAESFFDEMEALQWTYKGQPCVIKSAWQGRFRKFATYWHNNRANPRPFSK